MDGGAVTQQQWTGTADNYAAVKADVSLWTDYDDAQRIARLRAAHRGQRQRRYTRWRWPVGNGGRAIRTWHVRDAITPAHAVLRRAEEIADARSIFAHPALPVALSRDMVPPVPSVLYVDDDHRQRQDDLLRRAYLEHVARRGGAPGAMRT